MGLLPFLQDESSGAPHETFFWRVGNAVTLRSGDWKIVRTPVKGAAVPWEFSDLATDPREANSLVGSEPAHLQYLPEAWEVYNAEMIAPVFR